MRQRVNLHFAPKMATATANRRGEKANGRYTKEGTVESGKRVRTFVCLVHELEELVDDGFEELPVRLQESGVLTDDVHNVRCNNSLVVLPSFNLAQTQQILDNGHQEALLCLLVCAITLV